MINKRIIPYGKQWLFKEDINSVANVLRSDWITQGPKIKAFEDAICNYCGCKYAVVVSSGTAALHIACLAAGLKKGDQAITTPLTFLATANSVLYSGAEVIFADIDYATGNIDTRQIEKKITRKTKVLLPVDFAGLPCDLSEIKKIAKRYKLLVIEDSCHALGATYKNSKIGDCNYSDMTIFSFHPVKHITTGEGGAITTNSKKLYNRLIALRNHGMCKKAQTLKKEGSWYYEMNYLGFNYRITDLQSVLGLSQINKLPLFIKRRNLIANRYDQAFFCFRDLLTLPSINYGDRTHAWHLYTLRLNMAKKYISRRQLFELLHKEGVRVQVHYIPITRQPYYREKGFKSSLFPNAEKYYENVISLPIYPKMDNSDIDYVIGVVSKIIDKYCRQGGSK
ncbi:MAG: UDP-4-amino-4,6-dideoxy-N-acetyl-beta-L-altrosamine transaminase [Patescibacteria group bacterium]